MPGTLGIAEQAILASTLHWTRHESDTGRIAWQSGPYRVLSEGDNPRYWTATVRIERDRVELGAGAGDLGLAKCVRNCEAHAQAPILDNVSLKGTPSHEPANQQPSKSEVVINRAVCGPAAIHPEDNSPQRQQELL